MIKVSNVFIYEIPFNRIKKNIFKSGRKDTLNINSKGDFSIGLYFSSIILKKDFRVIVDKYYFNENGKPFLKSSEFSFSISYTDDYVYIAFAKDHLIGIDAEKVKEIDINVSEQFMSEKELKFLEKVTSKHDYFYIIWTLKESYLKLTGKGIDDNLNKIEFDQNTDGKYFLIENSEKKMYFYDLSSKGCIISIASFNEVTCKMLDFENTEKFLEKYEN